MNLYHSSSDRSSAEGESIATRGTVFLNPSIPVLCENIVRRDEGKLTESGSIVVDTVPYTGRSPDDKFIVQTRDSAGKVWWGSVNRPFDLTKFSSLYRRVRNYLSDKDIYIRDCFVGADPGFRVGVRVISETAWHSLVASHLFISEEEAGNTACLQKLTVIYVPNFKAAPSRDGTRSEAFILLNLDEKVILIGGTSYAGEMKKAVFTFLNHLLPLDNILTMHCSANVGSSDDVALFFGLSGTGKTTLSTDPERKLIGDDEHAWSDRGICNLEGGCYAKVARLSEKAEPLIFAAARRFGTVLENVKLDEVTRRMDLDDISHTENTRATYSLSYIPSSLPLALAGHPKHIFMLSADAFGVLPPAAKLTTQQAAYYYLLGYTAKVAGTERGLLPEPQATFSACFGSPFLPLPPSVYAGLLADKLAHHQAQCWLINTGWIGGPYGVGQRMPIAATRAIIRAILNGKLEQAPVDTDPIFGLQIPRYCDGVPTEMLQPRLAWADAGSYDQQARKLKASFEQNSRSTNN